MSYLGCLIFGFTPSGWLHPATQTPVYHENIIFIYAFLIYVPVPAGSVLLTLPN
jgi:hypothetical protein